MATSETLEQIRKAGEEASGRFAKSKDNKPAYTTRAWTGTFIFPIIGTIIGLFVKSEGVESFERGIVAAKKNAEYIKAKELGINGEELAKFGKDAAVAEKLHDKIQPNDRVFWGATIGIFTLGPLLPLAATVINMVDRSFAKREARKAGDKLYTEIVNESKETKREVS